MITVLDDAIGRLIHALEQADILRNTVVVFTTDHGDYLGDHQLMLKAPIHYGSLIRTPLIWTDPAAAHTQLRRSQALTGTLDLARTILDRAGVQAPNGAQGKSLLPVLAGATQEDREDVLIEDEHADLRCQLFERLARRMLDAANRSQAPTHMA